MPSYCSVCKKIGHLDKVCKVKTTATKIWKVKEANATSLPEIGESTQQVSAAEPVIIKDKLARESVLPVTVVADSSLLISATKQSKPESKHEETSLGLPRVTDGQLQCNPSDDLPITTPPLVVATEVSVQAFPTLQDTIQKKKAIGKSNERSIHGFTFSTNKFEALANPEADARKPRAASFGVVALMKEITNKKKKHIDKFKSDKDASSSVGGSNSRIPSQ
ncbi:hypothetical protein V6N11_041960 [Hibiscus sabdariffa]|uniref:Uncharacterized protein n=1 Tax=Hibiscus sabdariffa TaxID=183260 RepID=A0ABR2QV20_9ROSI